MNTIKINKEQIINQAMKLANEKGIENLNIRDLASICEVSIGTIYNYFPSKSDLLLAVVSSFWLQACNHENLKNISLDNFFDGYRLLYRQLYTYLKQFQGHWKPLLQLLDPPAIKQGQALEQDYFQNMRKMLKVLLDKDTVLPHSTWKDGFTKESFVDFLFENTMIQLNKDIEEPDYLILT